MTQGISIRRAAPADAAAISALLSASYRRIGEAYDPEAFEKALPLMANANPKLIASQTYYVAEIEGSLAGCGGWTLERPGTGEVIGGVGHIRHFATHPDHARKGVARALLDHCLAEARERGLSVMMSNSTLPAVAFYASAGFGKVAAIEVEMGPGVVLPAVEMRLDLS